MGSKLILHARPNPTKHPARIVSRSLPPDATRYRKNRDHMLKKVIKVSNVKKCDSCMCITAKDTRMAAINPVAFPKAFRDNNATAKMVPRSANSENHLPKIRGSNWSVAGNFWDIDWVISSR